MICLLVLSILLLVASEQLQRLLILAQVLITHGLVEGDLFLCPVIREGKSRLRVLQEDVTVALASKDALPIKAIAAIIQRL